ncbi:MAG: sulfatase [Anaerolineales bacterium]|nr:MAG: sulfatase [Anaerolineales bacterium]
MRVKTSVRLWTFLIATFLLTLSGCVTHFQKDGRPNILIIVTDDQRYDTMEFMPQTQAAIFDQGVTFQHGFVTTPLCCPSRASIFTGMYAHKHGVTNNNAELEYPTFIELMKKNGYYTGLVGKYLNSWKGEPRPEYDYWISFQFGETRYYNPRLNVNGEWIRHQGEYVTYSLGNYVIDFLRKAEKKNKPFILIYTPNAPHNPATPADEDLNTFADLPPHRPPSFDEPDIADKPEWMLRDGPLHPDIIKMIDDFRLNQIRTLVSLDRTIGSIMTELAELNMLDNTVIIFISDNGIHWGEHRLFSKSTIYDETNRVPFALRYPSLVPRPYIDRQHVVANIDIAPTSLDIAGIPIPKDMDGMSILKLLSGNGNWREGVLIEGWPPRGIYSAVHTGNYVYAETLGDISEFYDLEKDPYQLQNIVNDPQYHDIVEEHRKLLLELTR